MTHMVDLSESAGMRKTNCKSLSDADIAFVRSGLARGKTVHAISAEMHRDHRTIKLRLREDGIEWRTRAPARAVAPPPSGRTRDPLPAGHPLSWDLINQGLSIADCPFTHSAA